MAFTEDLMNMFSPSEAEAAPGRSAMVNPKQSPTLGGQPISGFDTGKFVQSMLIKQLSEGLAEQKQQAASTAKQSDPMYQAKLKNEQMKGQPQDVQSLIGRGQPQADQGPQGPQMPVTFGRNPQTGVWSFNNQGYVDFPEDIQGQQEVPEWIRSNPRMREIAEAYASPKHQQLVEQIRNQHEMMQTASTPDGASALQGTIDPQKQATARANAAISLKGKMSDKEAEKFLDRQFPLTADIPTDATAENLQQFATPAELASMKKLATYDLPFTGRQGLNSPGMQRLVQGATVINPDFSVPQYQARQKLKVSFASGPDKINIQSLNTVLPHMASLAEAGRTLENSPSPFWNAIQNMGRNATGDGRVGAFNFAAGRVADELERTFRGTGGNLAEIQDLRQSFSAANSPDQMKKTIDKAIDMLKGRVNALRGSWRQTMETEYPKSLVFPETQKYLSKIGIKPGELEDLDAIKQASIAEGKTAAASGAGGDGQPPAGGAEGLNLSPEQIHAGLMAINGTNVPPEKKQSITQQFMNIIKTGALPTAGGVAGGAIGTLAGPAGTIAGEAGGSMLGEWLNQQLGITEPSKAGLIMAAMAPGAGRLAMKGAGIVGRGLISTFAPKTPMAELAPGISDMLTSAATRIRGLAQQAKGNVEAAMGGVEHIDTPLASSTSFQMQPKSGVSWKTSPGKPAQMVSSEAETGPLAQIHQELSSGKVTPQRTGQILDELEQFSKAKDLNVAGQANHLKQQLLRDVSNAKNPASKAVLQREVPVAMEKSASQLEEWLVPGGQVVHYNTDGSLTVNAAALKNLISRSPDFVKGLGKAGMEDLTKTVEQAFSQIRLMPSDAAGVGKFMLAHHVGGMILGGAIGGGLGFAGGGAPGAMVGGIGGLAGVAVLPPLILRAAMTQPGRKLVQQLFKEIPGRTVDPMSVIPALTNFLVAQARAPKKMTAAMEEAQ